MGRTPHRIRTQRWKVKAPSETDAFALRQRMREEWEEKLMAAFERAFDEAAAAAGAEDMTIHLPKLELDLRLASQKELSAELPDMIYRQLGERLRAMLDDAARFGGSEKARVSTPEEDRFERLLHYLHEGSLPWSVATIDDPATASELRETCRHELARLIAIVRRERPGAPLLFRLLQLLDDGELPELVRALLGETPHAGEAAIASIIETLARTDGDRHGPLQHAATLIADALHGADGDRAGDSNRPASDGAEDDGADDDGIGGDLFKELDELLESLEDVSRSLEELDELVSDAGDDDALEGLFDGLSQHLRDRFGDGEDGDDDAVDRRAMLRFTASLMAAGLRAATSVSEVDEGAQILYDLLIELDVADALIFIDALLSELAQPWKDDVMRIVKMVVETEGGALGRPIRMRIAAMILAESLRNARRSSPPFFGEALGRILTPEEQLELRRLLALLPESILALLALGTAPRGGEERKVRDERSNGTIDSSYAESIPYQQPQFASKTSSSPILVPHTGLVILHSFIQPLFVNRGIIAPGAKEIAEPALPRAAALIHFMATGRTEIFEFELGFVKLLLGLTPETSLSVAEGLLDDADREEVEGLLDSAISYWSALKSTSRDGFRASFLQRKGLLRSESDGWRLQVERASFDMLLGHLPWGISIVKLPWMPKPIHVDWERQ